MVKHLNERKIGTRLLFGGNLIRQPYMKGRDYVVSGSMENGDKIMRDTFWIGVYPGLSEDHIAYMLDKIRTFCGAAAMAA